MAALTSQKDGIWNETGVFASTPGSGDVVTLRHFVMIPKAVASGAAFRASAICGSLTLTAAMQTTSGNVVPSTQYTSTQTVSIGVFAGVPAGLYVKGAGVAGRLQFASVGAVVQGSGSTASKPSGQH